MFRSWPRDGGGWREAHRRGSRLTFTQRRRGRRGEGDCQWLHGHQSQSQAINQILRRGMEGDGRVLTLPVIAVSTILTAVAVVPIDISINVAIGVPIDVPVNVPIDVLHFLVTV